MLQHRKAATPERLGHVVESTAVLWARCAREHPSHECRPSNEWQRRRSRACTGAADRMMGVAAGNLTVWGWPSGTSPRTARLTESAPLLLLPG